MYIKVNIMDKENENKKEACKLCGNMTAAVFNINLRAVPVCESCSSSIFIQQASWYVAQ